jgi:hypothetical protein
MSYLAVFGPKRTGETERYEVRWGAPDWATSTTYNVGDLVRDPSTDLYYECKVGHAAAAAFSTDSSNWRKRGQMLLDDANGETVSSQTLTASSTEITIESESIINNRWSRFFVSGGTDGTDYTIEVQATTDGSRILERTVKLVVQDP